MAYSQRVGTIVAVLHYDPTPDKACDGDFGPYPTTALFRADSAFFESPDLGK